MSNLHRGAQQHATGWLRRWAGEIALAAFTALVIGAFIGLMTLDLVKMRRDALIASERNTAAFAMMLAENVRQTVLTVDDALKDFGRQMGGDANRSEAAMARLRAHVISRLDGMPAVKSFVAFGADGEAFINWRNWPHRTDGATRDYFIAHRDNPNLGLFVSSVFINPTSGEYVIALTRRLNNPDGSFAGVFAISIDPEYLQAIYDRAAHSKNGSLALWRDDSMLLVRHPFDPAAIGRTYPTQRFSEMREAGSYHAVSAVDGVERIVSYRKVEGAPLIVAVTESDDEVLSGWRELVGRYIGLAGAIAFAVIAFAVAMHRQMTTRLTSEQRFRAAVDSTSSAFFALRAAIIFDSGPDFTITDANVAAGALLGIDRGALSGKSLAAVAPALCGSTILAMCVESHESGQPRDAQVKLPVADMGARWFRVRTTPFGDGIALAMRDVTEEREAGEVLRAAKNSAESANRTKSEFLANMSHELRTPLNAIIGFSESLQRGLFGGLTDKQREYVSDIHGAGQHLLAIINDVLDLSRIESGKTALFEETVSIELLIARPLRMVQPRAEEKRLVIATENLPALPDLRADGMRLQQVLLNLLSNAVKFTPDGGRITVSGAVDASGAVRIAVSDTGIGIAAADIPKILMPFEIVESAFTRHYKGTGLGLPLAKSLIEMHGGRLSIESRPGDGTTVTVLLPPERVVPRAVAQAV
jgi:signal transduction histidine kinase